ncbi:hypothetical protein TNIN_32071, partial [Trichonephila inaurata madagascariensis]
MKCKYCNLYFPELYDYFHHHCKFFDGQSSNEGHTGSIYLNEDDNKCMSINTHEEAVSQSIDFLQYNENQSWKETSNLKSALEHVCNNTEYCSQVQIFTQEKIPVFNLIQPSTSYGARQISENISQSSSIPPSVSGEFPSFHSNWESNPYLDKNQQPLSAEYNPMDYCDLGMNLKHEANDPVVKTAHENKQEYMSSSPSRMSHKNINLNLEKYSKMYPRNFDSFARSKVLKKEPQHEDDEGILQRNATLEIECGRNGHLHHESRAHNELEVTQENTNDVLMCQNVRDTYQISDEMQWGNLSGIKEERNDMVIELCEEDEILALDIPNCNENQLNYETTNESGTSLPHRTNFNNYSRGRLPIYQEYLEHKLNEYSTSSGIRNRSENYEQINTQFPIVPPRINSHQFINMIVNQNFNTNQPSASAESSQMGYFYNGLNALFNINALVAANVGKNKPETGKASTAQ